MCYSLCYWYFLFNAYDDEDVGADANLNNLETTMNVSPIPTTRIEKDHPKDQIIRELNSAIQTRRMTKISDEHAMCCWRTQKPHFVDFGLYLMLLSKHESSIQMEDFLTVLSSWPLV
ncbi:hypothetical protein Tco_1408541 [Tanacetum coccineum]